MEYIIGLVVVAVIGLLWHTNRKNSGKDVVIVPEAAGGDWGGPAPYKVETPVAVAPTVEEIAAVASIVSEPVKPAKKAPAKKAPAKKPAAMKAKEKAPAKKPAKAKKSA